MSNEGRSILELVIQHTGQVFPLPYESVTIGRGAENKIVLDDPQASPQHARLSWDGEAGVVTSNTWRVSVCPRQHSRSRRPDRRHKQKDEPLTGSSRRVFVLLRPA